MILKKAANDHEVLLLRGYMRPTEVPSEWGQFINFIDKCYKMPDPDQREDHKKDFMNAGRVRRGGLQIWGYMTIFAENPDLECFPELEGMYKKAHEEYGTHHRSSFALTNFSKDENITGRHDDLTHNLYFQCIGSVTWRIYDSKQPDVPWVEYELFPGDAIWVPSGKSHQVFAHKARTAITIAFEPDEGYDRGN